MYSMVNVLINFFILSEDMFDSSRAVNLPRFVLNDFRFKELNFRESDNPRFRNLIFENIVIFSILQIRLERLEI